jgi:hypothetical protein
MIRRADFLEILVIVVGVVLGSAQRSGAQPPSPPSARSGVAIALRLITAVALQTTSIWRDRIYLDMSALDQHYAATA